MMCVRCLWFERLIHIIELKLNNTKNIDILLTKNRKIKIKRIITKKYTSINL